MGSATQLATSAVDKLLSGFRPSTLRQYHRMCMDFMAFQVAAWLLSHQVNVHLLLSFLEYLNHNGIAYSQSQNYLRLSLFLKALKVQAPFNPRIPAHLDVSLLYVIKQCESFEFPVVFKPLYLVVFFPFLRLSNVLPHSMGSFDHTRQLARTDVILGNC